MSIINKSDRSYMNEDGNVLFLILIAVALFAALSYAVTSSSRGGGGNAGSEANLVNSASVTQYPASLNTAIIRMVVGGEALAAIRFNRPNEFTNLDANNIGIFHPLGGGASYVTAPANVMVDGAPGDWFFSADYEVLELGTSDDAGGGSSEIIAFLPGINQAICEAINEEHGVTAAGVVPPSVAITIPVGIGADPDLVDDGTTDYVYPVANPVNIADAGTTFTGRPFGCFANIAPATVEFVYYHVINER